MKKWLVLLVLPLLCFGFFNWFSSAPEITGKQATPIKVYPGQSLNIMVSFQDEYGIEKATAYFQHENGEDEVDMILSAGYPTEGTYSANWIVHDTLNQVWYNTRVVLTNKKGESVETLVAWQDPTQSHSLDQIKPGETVVSNVIADGLSYNFTRSENSVNVPVDSDFVKIVTYRGNGLLVNVSAAASTKDYAIKGIGDTASSYTDRDIGVYGVGRDGVRGTGGNDSWIKYGVYGQGGTGVRGDAKNQYGAGGKFYSYNNSDDNFGLYAQGYEIITGLTEDNCQLIYRDPTELPSRYYVYSVTVPDSCINSVCDVVLAAYNSSNEAYSMDSTRYYQLNDNGNAPDLIYYSSGDYTQGDTYRNGDTTMTEFLSANGNCRLSDEFFTPDVAHNSTTWALYDNSNAHYCVVYVCG